MTSPFIGEIHIFPYNFAPRNWAFCQGQLIAISQNTALFSLLGTQYGGNGQTTFALPNFGGTAAVAQGQGPGLTPRTMGETFGSNTVTLISTEMPTHNHGVVLYAQNTAAKRAASPSSGNALSVSSNTSATSFLPAGSTNTTFGTNMLGVAGGSQPHENRQPHLTLGFCIALQGIFPARN
ncbi:phage tail protein [Arenimonas terrae]|jgi:microcystin-dependent protein|uniref:Phage tail protein n=1 Tax=Arenimonas terrae TaxID=2546226 RepID=A0A5C4RQN9_9GAMM|nr:tail fiber protein [Arenimonas terrae]TNJ32877.1 phage tail protein [Arenimonas terrae]